MRFMQNKLYSIAVPFMLLPLMDFGFSEIPDYFRGLEFRTFIAEVISQLTSGVLDAIIIAVVGTFFGGA